MTFSVFTAGSCAGISTIKRGILSQLSADISASIRCLRECNIDGTLSAVAFYCCRSLRVFEFCIFEKSVRRKHLQDLIGAAKVEPRYE